MKGSQRYFYESIVQVLLLPLVFTVCLHSIVIAQQLTEFSGAVRYGRIEGFDSVRILFKENQQKFTQSIPTTVFKQVILPKPYKEWYCSVRLPGKTDTTLMKCSKFGRIKLMGRFGLPKMLIPGAFWTIVWKKRFDVYIQKGDEPVHTIMTNLTGNRWVVSAQPLGKDEEKYLKELISDIPELASKYENVHSIDYVLLEKIIEKYNVEYLKTSPGSKDAYDF